MFTNTEKRVENKTCSGVFLTKFVISSIKTKDKIERHKNTTTYTNHWRGYEFLGLNLIWFEPESVDNAVTWTNCSPVDVIMITEQLCCRLDKCLS